MDLDLSKKVALVSGSSRGLGLATAAALCQEGASVVLNGRRKSELLQAEKELSRLAGPEAVMSFEGDLTRPSGIRKCLAKIKRRFKRLDILIANIGDGRGDAGWQAQDSTWDALMDKNLLAPMRLVREAVPCLAASNAASIVLISSIAGLEPIGGPYAYGAAKAGLVYCAKRLARDLAGKKIRVNAVAPGNIYFAGGVWDEKLKKNRSKIMSTIRRVVPMQRFAVPEEVAGVVAFLASPRAGFMTGACVVVDGGQTCAF